MLLTLLKIVLSLTALVFLFFVIFIFGAFVYGFMEGIREESYNKKMEPVKKELANNLKIYEPEQD